MKRLLALSLALAIAFALAACGTELPAPSDNSSANFPSEQATATSSTSQTEESSANAQEEQKNPLLEPLPELAPVPPVSELTTEQFDEIWTAIFGYWNAAEGRFAVIDAMDSNTAIFSDGIWETSYGRDGAVSGCSSEKENELILTVFYHATEATEMEDAQPEQTETVVIDYSGLEQDGKIRIKIGDDDWRQYMFAGQTIEEAYQTYAENTNPN